jgi:hypothetical protein
MQPTTVASDPCLHLVACSLERIWRELVTLGKLHTRTREARGINAATKRLLSEEYYTLLSMHHSDLVRIKQDAVNARIFGSKTERKAFLAFKLC